MKKGVLSALMILFFLLFPLSSLAGYLFSQRLVKEDFSFDSPLSAPIKIVHLSDLHYPKCGVETDEIISSVETSSPDVIFLTGDIFDATATTEDLSDLEPFFRALRALSPVYAVCGNHEIGSPLYDTYRVVLKKAGVIFLENESAVLTVSDQEVYLFGVKDAALPPDCHDRSAAVKILLAHRPESFDEYASRGFTYCFCGHVHGGQVRIFSQGLVSPDRKLLPPYTSGAYRKNGLTMLVSRGLGDGKSKFRIFNPYHIVTVTLT